MVSFLNVFHRGRDEKGASCMTKQGNRYFHNCIGSKLAFSYCRYSILKIISRGLHYKLKTAKQQKYLPTCHDINLTFLC